MQTPVVWIAILACLALGGCVVDQRPVSDVCPLHQVRMRTETAPISYGLKSETWLEARRAAFPFGVPRGDGPCVVDEFRDTARIYLCPHCEAAYAQWRIEHGY